ncbi:MAG: 2,3-bisphosphoglycerate-independent phosphoglycerate mutase [Elusimicrobia bacterium]|jgi:2,3-bisphosphoglycerate-independent phosphoglycerate mutase|nr:2,3-bisphosphoglycerate-independent phosphoglycerate mutase [Elusimicrobiota bacterium]
MIGEDKLKNLIKENNTKIVLVVMDGAGDLPDESGKTALEQADIPNMDKLAGKSELGLTLPIDYGITPGSGPAHLSLFGYDPVKHEIGRGVLEAYGIGIELKSNQLAARANFATRNKDGIILDRRAGRIPTEENERLCKIINKNIDKIDDVKIEVYPGKEHRFVVVFTGENLHDGLLDADPEEVNKKEKLVQNTDEKSSKAADIANKFIKNLHVVLAGEEKANTCLLRGIAKKPAINGFKERYGLNARAIATYPMYKGLSRIVGMEVAEDLNTIEDEITSLKEDFNNFDFFYFHIKKTDSYGEDGNRKGKVKVMEEFDSHLPEILKLGPDVICVTADHSTPTTMSAHSWHPNPLLIYGQNLRKDRGSKFDESTCAEGVCGTMYAKNVMQLLLAQSSRLKKFGA